MIPSCETIHSAFKYATRLEQNLPVVCFELTMAVLDNPRKLYIKKLSRLRKEGIMNVLITEVKPGSGVAFETAKQLATQDYQVFAGVHTNEQLEAALELPESKDIVFFKFDINDPIDQELAGELDIDIFFGIAETDVNDSIAEVDMDLVRQSFETNVFSLFAIAQKVLPKMIEKGHGRLVFMPPLSSYHSFRFFGIHAATRATIGILASSLRKELKVRGLDIDVSIVMPVPYRPDFNKHLVKTKGIWRKKGNSPEHNMPCVYKRAHMMFNRSEEHEMESFMSPIMSAITCEHPHFAYKTPHSRNLRAKTMFKPICLCLCGSAVILGTVLTIKLVVDHHPHYITFIRNAKRQINRMFLHNLSCKRVFFSKVM